MLSSNFPEDTLFITIEEDWRLFDEEERDPVPEPTAGQEKSPTLKRKVDGSFVGAHYVEQKKDKRKDAGNSQVLEDIVSFCTAAHRQGKGEIVWLCWQPGQDDASVKRVNSIRSGAMMIAVDVPGARRLWEAFTKGDLHMGHFDCSLHFWLLKNDRGQDFASYLIPPLGNYKHHISGCEKEYATKPRPSCWTTRWVCPGTRRADDPKKRDKWIACHTSKGDPKWLTKVDLEREFESLAWQVFWKVPDQLRPDIAWAQRRDSSASASSPSAAEPTAAAPAARPTAAASSAAQPLTQRAGRRRRSNLFTVKFRNWTDDEDKAECQHSWIWQSFFSVKR